MKFMNERKKWRFGKNTTTYILKNLNLSQFISTLRMGKSLVVLTNLTDTHIVLTRIYARMLCCVVYEKKAISSKSTHQL